MGWLLTDVSGKGLTWRRGKRPLLSDTPDTPRAPQALDLGKKAELAKSLCLQQGYI